MNCPVCKTITLARTSLEPHLPSYPCGQCGGQWIRGEHYFAWLDQQAPITPDHAAPTAGVRDTTRAKLCPECGRFLTRYQVGHGVAFAIDRCACGGVWLDANEWESLRAHNLHAALHQIFSAAWQADVHRQDQQRRTDHLMTEKLGATDYAELKRLKSWLDTHPKRNELYAYLLNQQPTTDR